MAFWAKTCPAPGDGEEAGGLPNCLILSPGKKESRSLEKGRSPCRGPFLQSYMGPQMVNRFDRADLDCQMLNYERHNGTDPRERGRYLEASEMRQTRKGKVDS